ncbi:MAG: 4Fe-4S dicluster domain-containing protein [Bacteroidales bacterium]
MSACPTSVLQPSFREYGLLGIMQPRMDYHKGFCNFECTVCVDVCPSGALLPLVLEAKKLTQLGKAKFIKENCIVETERTDCRACSEHCPTKAVKMVPFEGNLVIPEVTDDICIVAVPVNMHALPSPSRQYMSTETRYTLMPKSPGGGIVHQGVRGISVLKGFVWVLDSSITHWCVNYRLSSNRLITSNRLKQIDNEPSPVVGGYVLKNV